MTKTMRNGWNVLVPLSTHLPDKVRKDLYKSFALQGCSPHCVLSNPIPTVVHCPLVCLPAPLGPGQAVAPKVATHPQTQGGAPKNEPVIFTLWSFRTQSWILKDMSPHIPKNVNASPTLQISMTRMCFDVLKCPRI